MVPFMIYLLETGICLSLLYLAYWLFLRKETYFNFNRVFLVGSIVLALLVPLLHLSLDIQLGSALENPARGISNFRSGYEELIRMLDADFGTEPGEEHMLTRGTGSTTTEAGGEHGTIPREGKHGEQWEPVHSESEKEHDSERSKASLSRLLLFIYIGGVLYFLARFIYLVIRLYLLAKRNGVTRQDGFRMVEIKEEISPFSFFRYLFINNGSFDDSELHHVLEHEKAHIRQRHTTDHLFAYGLAVFQWFNPFAWQVRKALKTTHEYIADRQVIDKGFERIDYQALLLKQVIGYHSVELVNNFNLKPIKKRITMMNKTKSGLPAKLKATLVAPFAILVFFLFADFTLKGSDNKAHDYGPDLSGLWVKQTKDDFSNILYIDGNIFSFSEGLEIRDFLLQVEDDVLVLSTKESSAGTPLRYILNGNELRLWWAQDQSSTYVRSDAANTLDHYLNQNSMDLDLPYLFQYRLMDSENLMCRVGLGKDGDSEWALTFNGKQVTLDEMTGLVESEKERVFMLDQSRFTVMFLVDRDVPMSQLDKVRQELRRTGSLHIAEGGYPHGDLALSPLLYHSVALPRVLPPLEAKMLNKKEMEKLGDMLHTIDLTARNSTPGEVDEKLRKFIESKEDGKYVISLEYDGDIPYGQYVESVDMVWKTVYSFRNKLAMDRYNIPYDKLGDDIQKDLRRTYPMALSESMKK
ncbi:MAG: M56 family metallopeptidase [Bacteroidota bacterium]|nr:M56 family metallopeptidase [Bacteroidota bacterium]